MERFKRFIFSLLTYFILFPPSAALAQCVIDANYSTVGAHPTDLPKACVGSPYSATIQLVYPIDTFVLNQTIPFDSFQVLQVWSSVPGLNFTCFNSPSCVVYPPVNGPVARSCIEVSGTPLMQTNLSVPIYIETRYWVTIFGAINSLDTFAVQLEVIGTPQAAFTYSVNGSTFSFTNNSSNAGFYQWDFGDGNQSSAQDPTHTYSTPGVYQVCLTAAGDLLVCPSSTSCQSVNVLVSRDEEFSGVSHYPNPCQGSFFMEGLPPETEITIWNIQGELVWKAISEQEKVLVDLPSSSNGIYLVRLTSDGATKTCKAMVLEE